MMPTLQICKFYSITSITIIKLLVVLSEQTEANVNRYDFPDWSPVSVFESPFTTDSET